MEFGKLVSSHVKRKHRYYTEKFSKMISLASGNDLDVTGAISDIPQRANSRILEQNYEALTEKSVKASFFTKIKMADENGKRRGIPHRVIE